MSKEILKEDGNEEENVSDGEEMEEELNDEWTEKSEIELDETEVEETKKFRCQKRKKRKCVTGETVPELRHIAEDEDKNEDEEDQQNSEDEEEESLSEYESILSAVSFEWENEHYEFIDLCDPGTMDNIYSREEVGIVCDIYGKIHYLEECNELKIPPIIRFYNALNTNEADLTFHGITNKQMKAICTSLEINQCVETLVLKGNPLSRISCTSLSGLLLKNSTITCLDLSGCRIGSGGAASLARGLKDNEAVKELNLSKCYIEDEGIKFLVDPLKNNYFIEKLTLSYNNLGMESGEALGEILYFNNCIRSLDLDNNNMFYSASMRKFCKGFSFNTAVTSISLKWNAISAVDIGDAVSQFLKRNKTVKYLDLSDNRMDSQSVRALKRGIAGSQSIEIIRLARNPVVSEDAEYLLSAVKSCPSLKLLDLQDIWNLRRIQASKEVEVVVGGVYSEYTIRGPDYAALILKRAHYEAMKPKKSAAKRNLGHFMFMLGDEPLTTDQFMTLVSKFKAKINNELFPELIKQFAIPKINTIDVVAMRKKYLSLFPNSKPPEQKKQQKDEYSEEKTNTRVSATREENKEGGEENVGMSGASHG